MNRAGVVFLLVVVLLPVFGGVAGAQQTGNSSASDSGVPTVDQETVETSIGAGANVVDAEVLQEIDGGARVRLTIESDSSQRIRVPQIYRAMQTGGQMTYSRHRLADGRTEIEVRGFAYETGTARGKVYVAQVVNEGETYFILVDTEGTDIGPPPTQDEVAVGAGLSSAAIIMIGLAYVKREYAGQEQERKE